MQSDMTPHSLRWLALGLISGLIAALISVLTPSWGVEEDVQIVATVNGTFISREKYLSHLTALSTDKKDPVTAEDAEYVLGRIIEEELLVQRGVEVGLLESDKRTRAAMVNAMISMTTASAEATTPSERELQSFYEDNSDYFTPTARLRVRQLVVGGDNAQEKAQRAFARLSAGEGFEVVDRELGKAVALSIPDTLLPPAKVREYLGPSVVQLLQQQPAGFISRPQAQGSGFRIVMLVDKEEGARPVLASIRQQVEAEYVRRSGDQSLREYLEWLKDRADITYPSELPL